MERIDDNIEKISPRCDFCHLNTNSEEDHGLIRKLKTVSCHYYCLLFSTRLVQNGRSQDGILGFLHNDIVEELRKSKRNRCVYCNLTGATIFCCNRSCYKKFHFPCGKRNGALSLFYGTYQSFCNTHIKNQIIPKHVLLKRKILIVKLEKCDVNELKSMLKSKTFNQNINKISTHENSVTESDKCGICHECTIAYPLNDLLWPPCCKGYVWFHKKCIQKQALSAGEYHMRCPLCNNQSEFIDTLDKCGIYIPSRDASWEREKGAFMELLERPENCSSETCICPKGRSYVRSKQWEIIACKYCGSDGAHSKCIDTNYFICQKCLEFVKPTTCNEGVSAREKSDEEVDIETISENDE